MSRCSPHIEQRPGEAVTLPLTKSITLGEDCVYRMVGHVCARGRSEGKMNVAVGPSGIQGPHQHQ